MPSKEALLLRQRRASDALRRAKYRADKTAIHIETADVEALAGLEALTKEHGSKRAAVEVALKVAGRLFALGNGSGVSGR